MEIGEELGNLAVNNYVMVYLSQFSYMLTNMLIGLLPGSGAIDTMEHYRREIEYIAMTRMLFITRNFPLSPRVETIIKRQLDEAGFFSNSTPVIRSIMNFLHVHGRLPSYWEVHHCLLHGQFHLDNLQQEDLDSEDEILTSEEEENGDIEDDDGELENGEEELKKEASGSQAHRP